eukprot:TRINITY_DN1997_c0_g3_i1.p2 TRINITY_DN1997_c0_g3~~TRINITY_DN1997_c0_g3_i1.p2  ORF type:complete len:158 (+),score=31.38 TRINITY_DN1997_c0_g3_i1:65-538(+)
MCIRDRFGTVRQQGKKHADSIKVTKDTDSVVRGQHNYKVSQIRLHTNQYFVVGLQFCYKLNDGREVVGNAALASNRMGAREESVYLDNDEFILEVYGRSDQYINYLGFRTNKGRRIEGGGPGGNLFQYEAKPAEHFVNFNLCVGTCLLYTSPSPRDS